MGGWEMFLSLPGRDIYFTPMTYNTAGNNNRNAILTEIENILINRKNMIEEEIF